MISYTINFALALALTSVSIIAWAKGYMRRLLPISILLAVLAWIILVIRMFIVSTNEYEWWLIDTSLWADFGSFFGAFLLAATLIYQARVFRRQQIEAKFFEMVKYYRDNITEMKFRNPFHYTVKNVANKRNKNKDEDREFEEKYVEGRRVIKTIFEQYKVGQKLVKEVLDEFPDAIHSSIQAPTTIVGDYKIRWSKQQAQNKEFKPEEWTKRYAINEVAYLLTFWGVPHDTTDELKKYVSKIFNDKATKKLLEESAKMLAVYDFDDTKETYSASLRTRIEKNKPLEKEECKFDGRVKFFGGHQYHLGHYFRHMYQAVKYIDRQPWYLLSKNDKYDYIKTLRAQMSNYEQALLCINSLTKLGRKWEYENTEGKDLISEYNLINNLPEKFIPMIKPQFFYPKVDFEWREN